MKQQSGCLSKQEARLLELTTRILCHRPVTEEQVRDIGSLAADLAVIEPEPRVRGKLIAFRAPPQPDPGVAVEQLAKVLAELSGLETP